MDSRMYSERTYKEKKKSEESLEELRRAHLFGIEARPGSASKTTEIATGRPWKTVETSQRDTHTSTYPEGPSSVEDVSEADYGTMKLEEGIENLKGSQTVDTLLRGITTVFESGDILLLVERDATIQVLKKTLEVPDFREDLMELLEIPPDTSDHLLAQTALALKYTSVYMQGIFEISKDDVLKFESLGFGVPEYNDTENMRGALESVQKKKAEILENPSAVIFLPIKYSQGNIQEGTLQADRGEHRERVRVRVESDLDGLKFFEGSEEEQTRWQSKSSILRFYLAHLSPQFQGKEVFSLEIRSIYQSRGGPQVMLKMTMKGGEVWFSNSPLDGTTFAKTNCSKFFSGDQIEIDYTDCNLVTISNGGWQSEVKNWHLSNRDYQSSYHPMMVDYADSVFNTLISEERKKISIMEIGCGSGDLSELMLKKLKGKYSKVPVIYSMVDINEHDIERAKERFKRLDRGQWEVQPMVRDIFSYEYDAVKAVKDMKIPDKVDIIISCGGPFSPQVGGNLEETLKLYRMCADMLNEGGYFLLTGGSGVELNRSHHEQHGMEVKNTYHTIGREAPMHVIRKPHSK